MRRRTVIAAGVLVFLAISFLLARWLHAESRERTEIHRVLQAQVAGDARLMLERLDPSCAADATCRATVAANARRLARGGDPKILNLQSQTAYALGAATGLTRVAWTVVGRGLPVVQCVRVHRGGSVLGGRTVILETIGAPIGNESTC
jgi:hypothetical protein